MSSKPESAINKLPLLMGLDENPPMSKKLVLAFQCLIANLPQVPVVALILAGVLKLTIEETVTLIQGVTLGCGIATFVMGYGFGPIGGRLPIYMGTSFSFIGVTIVVGSQFGLGAVFAFCFIGGLFYAFIGLFYDKLERLFPPVVRAAVALMIGVTVVNVAMQYYGGGQGVADFASPKHIIIASFVIVVTLFFNLYFKGFLSSIAVFIGLVAGTIMASFWGLFDPTPIANMSWVGFPSPFHWSWSIPSVGALISFLIIYLAVMVETIGNVHLACYYSNVESSSARVKGSLLLDGLSCSLAALFSGTPITSYSSSIGMVGVTRVASRHIVALAGLMTLFVAFLPKVAGLFALIPAAAFGGIFLYISGMIVSGAFSIIRMADTWEFREMTIFAVSVAFGLGIIATPEITQNLSTDLQYVFGNGIVVASIVAIVLNLIIPEKKVPNHAPENANSSQSI